MRYLVTCSATVALLAIVGAASAADSGGCGVTGPLGSGRTQVWLLTPAATPRSVVVFAHGWTATEPTDWHRVRFDHLCSRGSLVVFPRYQIDGLDSWQQGVDGFRRGVQIAFARLRPIKVPVVAAGFSFGAALASYYAGNAERWGVPSPYGVVGIFPTTRVPGRLAGRPRASVRFVLLAGDRDDVVGTAGAEDLLLWLKEHPQGRKTYRLVRSNGAFVAQHEAPKLMTAHSTRVFWAPIDQMVSAARGPA